MNREIEIQEKFETIVKSRYPVLQPIQKWNQRMWIREEKIIVALIFLSKKLKFCFFNNPNIELDKLQRWSSTIFSYNLEYENDELIEWDNVKHLIDSTIKDN